MCAMYAKHLRSVGCPVWNADYFESNGGGNALPPNLAVCDTYILATDSGGDEELAKTMVMEDTVNKDVNLKWSPSEGFSRVIFAFSAVCFMHQYQLIIKKSLIAGDLICEELEKIMNTKRKYFSTVATILHVWRDSAKAWNAAWKTLFSSADARVYSGSRPPLALSGRWGSVDAGETYLIRPPIRQLRAVCGRVQPLANKDHTS